MIDHLCAAVCIAGEATLSVIMFTAGSRKLVRTHAWSIVVRRQLLVNIHARSPVLAAMCPAGRQFTSANTSSFVTSSSVFSNKKRISVESLKQSPLKTRTDKYVETDVTPISPPPKRFTTQGEWRSGKFYGKRIYDDGKIFEGEIKNGKPWNGIGVLKANNGDVFEGELKEGKLWNGSGMLTSPNGDQYEGCFKKGKMHGQGKLIYATRRFREGESRMGFVEGPGRILEGEFREGKLWNGISKTTHKDGNVTEKEFREGQY